MIVWRDPQRERERGRDAWLETRPSVRVASIWRGESGRVLWLVYLPAGRQTLSRGVAGDWEQARETVEEIVREHVRLVRELSP